MVTKNHKVLTDREQKLMSGVFLKEQEIKNLLNLGLGEMLRELKKLKESNTITYQNMARVDLNKNLHLSRDLQKTDS